MVMSIGETIPYVRIRGAHLPVILEQGSSPFSFFSFFHLLPIGLSVDDTVE